MIQIDSKYDIILTYSPIIEITGHIFECFDYYLFLRQYCKVGILFFCGLKKEKLKIAFESKYNVLFSDIENDFIQLNDFKPNGEKQIISFGKNTTVILTDGNIKSLDYYNIILATNKLYGFLCEYDDFHKIKSNNHITYLQDYRIYGKNKYFKSIDYVKKIPFKFYKKCNRIQKNIGMIYMTYVCRKVTPDIIVKYHKMSGCEKTLLIVPYKLPEYDNLQNITQIEAPVDDFFNQFDTYIYTPVNRKFDCSPRLVTECFMQGKKVFKQLDYYDIGLETRYNDCITDINKLNLTDNDEILKLKKKNNKSYKFI